MKNKTTNEETTQATEYKNEHLTVMAHDMPGCRVKLEISVTPVASQAAYKKAIKSINKEVSIPGFRKGKAPEALIKQNYASYIDQEFKEIVLQTAFKEAVALTNVYPLNQDSVKKPVIKSASQDTGAEIVIEFESGPKVPEINGDDLKIDAVDKKEITQKEIDESIENIRLHNAQWEEVTDHAVEEGDYIDVDIEDKDVAGKMICKDTRFQVTEGKMGDWMRALVVGKNVGDVVEGMSERTPDMDPKAEFKPTNCKITIKAIKKAVLPEMDEAFAKKVGANDLNDLNEKVVASLNSQADEEVQEKLRDQLEEILLERFSFDVPASLVDREVKNRLEYLRRELTKAKKPADEIKAKVEEMRESTENNVKKAFQMFFIAQNLAAKHHIQVSQDELIRELMLQMYSPTSAMDTSTDPEEARSKIYISLLTQKVKDFLIDQATVEKI